MHFRKINKNYGDGLLTQTVAAPPFFAVFLGFSDILVFGFCGVSL